MFGAGAAALLRIACVGRARRFGKALDDVDSAQRAVLARIVRASAATGYGRSLGLAGDESFEAFRGKVPLVDYAVIAPWIEAQRSGTAAAIAPGTTRCYEPTSGSSGAIKRIPYNDALLGAFRGMFAIWAHDLLTHALRLRSGRSFISLSPPLDSGEGFADDREYLGWPLRALTGRFIVTPPKLRDPEAFRDALADALLAAEDLEIVSVWNPTYLLVLLDHIEANRERLSEALPPGRRALLRRDPLPWAEIWPSLQLLSCWSAAAAAGPARALARRLPQALLQGKGLLATEAPVTVPLIQANGCVPLVDSVFLELEDDGGRLHLLSEVEPDAESEYALIVTQPGGLLRYRLGDRVRVSGRYRDAPLLEFIGRVDRVCDLVGEKLGETCVASALSGIAGSETFATLLPLLPQNRPPRYCLLTDHPDPRIAGQLEAALMKVLRYREARLLGQLAAVEVLADEGMRRMVHDALIASGMKAGDIKDSALIVSLDLARRVHAKALQRISA